MYPDIPRESQRAEHSHRSLLPPRSCISPACSGLLTPRGRVFRPKLLVVPAIGTGTPGTRPSHAEHSSIGAAMRPSFVVSSTQSGGTLTLLRLRLRFPRRFPSKDDRNSSSLEAHRASVEGDLRFARLSAGGRKRRSFCVALPKHSRRLSPEWREPAFVSMPRPLPLQTSTTTHRR